MLARTNPARSAALMNRTLAKRLKDQPANAISDSQPSYIDVVSNLAEDTVIAESLDIAPGENKQAMFANPFAGGSEEMLFVDEQNNLRWARHLNPGDAAPEGLLGWTVEPVASGTLEVVVVVHPDDTVYAFTLSHPQEFPGETRINLFALTADPAVLGGVRWSETDFPFADFGAVPKTFLQVTYTNNRPANPVVFVDSPSTGTLWWVMPNYPAQHGVPASSPWWLVDSMRYDPRDTSASAKVAGIASTNLEFSQEPLVPNITLWSLIGEELYVTEYNPRTREADRDLVSLKVMELVGPWTVPHHAGVVYVFQPDGEVPALLTSYRLEAGTGYPTAAVRLDALLNDKAVWQDAEGLLHIYGRDADATLRVIHQTGWETDVSVLPGGAFVPVYETHFDSVGEVRGTTRALIASVARFSVDPYPDDMPDQHVVHQGVDAGEANALYAQSVRTSYWHEERIRLVPETLPKPYLVPRYETTMIVKNSYGAPVGGCEVRLTADVPVDLEVDGRFYRTGTVVPAVLRADARGQVTLRVVARTLNVPHLTVTVPGMAQSLTVQMAGDVHRFLGGTDTLPTHQDGFTPQVVKDAKVPGTQDPLFAKIAPDERQDGDIPWPPTAKELVTWCQGAFAVEAGTPLPPAMFEGLSEEQEVCGFTIQASNPNRPGFEVFGSADQLRAHRESLREEGVLEDLDTWFGDVWQAIGDGIVSLARATINLVDQTVEFVIYLADEIEALFVCAWDDIVSAAQAVEAAFVAVGAEIEKVIDWLKWLFDFGDAFKVAKHLYSAIDAVPDMVKDTVKILVTEVDDFFISKEEEVRAWFASVKQTLGDRSIGSLQGASGAVPAQGQPDAQTTTATDELQGPHANWFTDKVFGAPSSDSPSALSTELDAALGDAFDSFVAIFKGSSNMGELTDSLSGLGDLFWDLFSGKDADSVLATGLATLLDLVESVIIWVLKTLDDVVDGALDWAATAVDLIGDLARTSLEDVPVLSWLWDFMLNEAGLSKADYPFTVGMVSAFFVAYPYTVIMKLVTDQSPFPDGIPMPPRIAGSEAAEVGGEVPFGAAILSFQAFQGVTQTIDFYLDLVLNNSVLSAGEWKVTGTLLKVFSFAHLWAYVVGDHPWMWGYPYPPGKTHWILPYIRYAPTALLNLVDLVTSFKFGTIAEIFEAADDNPDKELLDSIFAGFVFLCGWERIGTNIAEFKYLSNPATGPDFDEAAPNWYDWWNLWINITAYIQTATGFIRYFAQHPFEFELFEEFIWAALGVKNVVDVAGDVFSGVCTVIQPARELLSATVIQDKPVGDNSLQFEEALLYQPYESTTVVQVKGGWPYYVWDALNPDDPSQGGWLPLGLRLERLELSSGWIGDGVRIVGVPLEQGVMYAFDLTVSDNYGPSSTDSIPALIDVQSQDPGLTASFTCSATAGVFPLPVTFTNTTTDPFTEVHWDFGDGQTSSDPNPTITYQWSGEFTAILACKGVNGWGAASQTITVTVS